MSWAAVIAPTTVFLIRTPSLSSRVCNHEVNQHDTRSSITPAPFGVTGLLPESIQSEKRKRKHVFQKQGSGHEVGFFHPVSAHCMLSMYYMYLLREPLDLMGPRVILFY